MRLCEVCEENEAKVRNSEILWEDCFIGDLWLEVCMECNRDDTPIAIDAEGLSYE